LKDERERGVAETEQLTADDDETGACKDIAAVVEEMSEGVGVSSK
jgi:hypothetical protein